MGSTAAPRPLFVFAVVVVLAVLVLIKIGAMVTSTNSGLAVIAWPGTETGELWPAETRSKLEMGHRYAGMVIGLLSIALAVSVWRGDRRRWLRLLAWAVVGLVTTQGVIGAVGVFKKLP